jgi:hypothetical protein
MTNAAFNAEMKKRLEGISDKALLREAWGVELDRRAKAGEITQRAYATWQYPKEWD